MMLPGVEVARKRRMHNHEVHPWVVPHGHKSHPRMSPVRSGMPELAMAARMRLEERLRGTTGSTSPSSSSSRWTQFLCDGASTSRQQTTTSGTNNETISGQVNQIEYAPKPTVQDSPLLNQLAVLKVDGLCPVCLIRMKGTKKSVIPLPCSHK